MLFITDVDIFGVLVINEGLFINDVIIGKLNKQTIMMLVHDLGSKGISPKDCENLDLVRSQMLTV